MNMADHTNLNLAMRLARAGLPVFPCLEATGLALDRDGKPKGAKAPYTSAGFKSATTDDTTIQAWWARWPNAVPGIPTGEPTGLAVIDGDVDRGTGEPTGETQIAQLGLDHPGAVHVRTQSGGVQIIYRHTEGARTTSRQVESHIDTRGEGGYIIAPGSVMADGARYSYEGRTLGAALKKGDLPSFPLQAVEAAIAAKKRAQGAARGQSATDAVYEDQTEATDAETLEVLRTLLSEAPNHLCREDWVKLAVSLRAAYGETLRDAFMHFSLRYGGGTPCTSQAAVHVWETSGEPKTITGIAPAFALLKRAVGPDRFKAIWRATFQRTRQNENTTSSAQLADWTEPAPKLLQPERPSAPALPMEDVFGPRFAVWAKGAADAKGAPVDYVALSVLSVLSSVIGNTRWVSPWNGWAEPPVIWVMLIGLPSAGKSPAADAALQPLRAAERPLRDAAKAELTEWAERAEVAKLAEAAWKDAVKTALKEGKTPPDKPREAEPGPSPHVTRLVVNDGTIERIGAILADQPRGILQMRDELAGWLEGMARYSGGGSDRPFWLEAYGGRGYTVERIGRDPITIERLTVAVMGGVQPDRLKSLLFKTDDDGLLARFLPIWPEPAPVRRPGAWADEDMMRRVLGKLLTLDMVTDEDDEHRPWIVGFTDEARDLMDEFRMAVRGWEAETEGLLLSFIGKLPGLTARMSLVLAFLDWAAEGADEPREITIGHFGRAAHLIEAYILPMAHRAYADASTSKAERAALRLVGVIQKQGWSRFTSRDVLRLERAGLGTKADLDPALDVLLDADVIREAPKTSGPQGGRHKRLFEVNPAILGARS